MPVARDLLKNNPDVDECIVATKRIFRDIMQMPQFDLVLDLFNNRATQLICLLSGARHRVGRGRVSSVGRLQPYNITVPEDSGQDHVLSDFARFARVIGLPDPPPRTTLVLDRSERNFACAFLNNLAVGPHGHWIALHPGKRHAKPPWSTDKFVALGESLHRRFGYPILIFSGPSDGTPIAQEVGLRLGERSFVVPVLPIRESAAVLERCTLLVASEGGIGHIAAALGIKTVVISGMRGTSFWYPYPREQGMIALEDFPPGNLSVEEVLSFAEMLLG
jgi:ADP-heptose:LPS heptosyltransferase